ncbi:ROK family glucokinase [Niallia sp. XMNu-256]|uniref:ROK family glucokinase n=1 Tax=Niallia sp. XMNu-256 TaxID=3082444 RepID=UPI0030D045DD
MENKWIVGIDIGGTTIKIAFISCIGEIIDKWEIPTNKNESGNKIPNEIARSIEIKLEQHGQTKDQLLGAGAGAPGPINDNDGSVYVGVNIGWKNFPLKEELQKELTLPVIVDNDANVAALGEMWKGAGEGAKDMVCITLGTGVGGGVIANGNILHGVNGAAGEIGHMTAVVEDGAPCNCGKFGCLETVASATGIVRLANEYLEMHEIPSVLRDIVPLTSKAIFDHAAAGDALAQRIVEKVAFYLGVSIANVANVTNPEKIVIGGGVSKAGKTLLDPIMKQFRRFAFPRVVQGADLALAMLGNDAGVIGAAWLVKNKI